MGVDRKENFRRIAEKRTNKIIDMIALLGNLANKSYYDYDDKQVNLIFDGIQKELDEQKSKFSKKEREKKKFRL